jgi:predicted esterase
MRVRRIARLLPALLPFLPSASPRPARAASFPPNLSGEKRGEIVSSISTISDPTQTYELYLPTGFKPERLAPVLFLFDPRSRGKVAAELFRPTAEELGWILVSSNNTMSDGPGGANARAINAMLPDAMRRLPADPKRMYAGGFSGGGVLAWTVGLKGKYLAGAISIGGRPAPEHAALKPNFPLFSAAGLADFNYQPTRELDAIAADAGVPHRLEFFPGPHAWCPPETARRALVWLETLAMRAGLAPRDGARIAKFLAEEQASAAAAESAGDLDAAARRFAEIGVAFNGLAAQSDLDAAAANARRLEADPRMKALRKDEKAAEKYESLGQRHIGEALELAHADEIPSPGALRHAVSLDDAKRRVAEGGGLGHAAERHLEAVASHLGFYFANEVMGTGDYRRAIPALEVALEARPDSPFVEYNLACARARSGDKAGALAALAAAVDHGLAQPLQMESDADLASLRGTTEFAALVARVRGLRPPDAP